MEGEGGREVEGKERGGREEEGKGRGVEILVMLPYFKCCCRQATS